METEKARHDTISIAVLDQGTICTELSMKLPLIVAHRHGKNHVKVQSFNKRPITNNRNYIVKKFLETEGVYLLMIDGDIAPPVNVLDLVDEKKDIVGAVCPQWHETDLYWVAMERKGDGYRQLPKERRNGLQEVDAVGTGCLLIHRRVLEDIDNPFLDKWENGLMVLGEDFMFCEKAKEHGYNIYAHFDYPCSHYKEMNLLDIYKLLARNHG